MSSRLRDVIRRFRRQQNDTMGAQERVDELDASALGWLIFDVSDTDAAAVGVQALGAIDPDSSLADRLRPPIMYHTVRGRCVTRSGTGLSVPEAIRVRRCALWLWMDELQSYPFPLSWDQSYYFGDRFSEEVDLSLRLSQYPDAVALYPRLLQTESDPGVSPSSTSTVLLSIRSDSGILGLSSLLERLLLCDFGAFADTDWDIVRGSFATVHHPAVCYLRTVESIRPLQLCLADLLAQIFVVVHDVRDRRNVVRMIYRLLAAMHPKFYSADSMLESPFLLEFLATSAFEQKHDIDSFAGALSFLRLGYVRTTKVMKQRLWRALALTLHAAPLQSDATRADLSLVLQTVCSDIGLLSERLEDAVGTLYAVLSPSAFPSIGQSIWSMIQRFRLTGIYLAERLAAALCMSIRRGDITVHQRPLLIDSYFAEMSPHDVVATLAKSPLGAHRNTFKIPLRKVHLIQHCTELRPEWWLAVLDYAEHSESEVERRMVLALQVEIARRGSCATCPHEVTLLIS